MIRDRLTPTRRIAIGGLLLPFTAVLLAEPIMSAYSNYGTTGAIVSAMTVTLGVLGGWLLTTGAINVNS